MCGSWILLDDSHTMYRYGSWMATFVLSEEKIDPKRVAPVVETGSRHRLTANKIVEHLFGLSYRKISGNNQVENSFFRISNISVSWPHAQLIGRTVIKNSLKLRIFLEPWGRDRSQSPPYWFFRVKQIHKSTISEGTTRLRKEHTTF